MTYIYQWACYYWHNILICFRANLRLCGVFFILIVFVLGNKNLYSITRLNLVIFFFRLNINFNFLFTAKGFIYGKRFRPQNGFKDNWIVFDLFSKCFNRILALYWDWKETLNIYWVLSLEIFKPQVGDVYIWFKKEGLISWQFQTNIFTVFYQNRFFVLLSPKK